eukprot:5449628-Pyramimonas_sp.AAC.2
MWASLLQTIVDDPLSMSDVWGAHDISSRLRFADVVLLPGTQQRRRAGDGATFQKLERHMTVNFG